MPPPRRWHGRIGPHTGTERAGAGRPSRGCAAPIAGIAGSDERVPSVVGPIAQQLDLGECRRCRLSDAHDRFSQAMCTAAKA